MMNFKRIRFLVLSTVLCLATLSQSFAAEVPMGQNSCLLKYQDARAAHIAETGGAIALAGLSPIFPLMIPFGIIAVPVGVWRAIKAYKMNTMTHLTEQAYEGKGSLLDELVEDVQAIKPELTRDQIRALYLLADSNLIFCSGGEPETYSSVVSAFTGERLNDDRLKPAIELGMNALPSVSDRTPPKAPIGLAIRDAVSTEAQQLLDCSGAE